MSTDRDLVITRDIAVPRDKLYRCWTEPDRETHEKMGFTEGWSLCTNQLAELAATL
jgi:uncharacterized protein YndB with AHSA1/START domain